MRVDRILYQKIFPTGMAYLNHKIGVEIQLDEGDSETQVFLHAKSLVEQWNIESNPSYAMAMEYMKPEESYQKANPFSYNQSQKTADEIKIGLTVDDIQSCKSKVVCSAYKPLVKGKPELETAWLKKMEEFV